MKDECSTRNNSKWKNPNTSGVNQEPASCGLLYTVPPRPSVHQLILPSVRPVLSVLLSILLKVWPSVLTSKTWHLNWHLGAGLILLSRLNFKVQPHSELIWKRADDSFFFHSLSLYLIKEAIGQRQKLHPLTHKLMLAWKYNGCFYWPVKTLVMRTKCSWLSRLNINHNVKNDYLGIGFIYRPNPPLSFPKGFLYMPFIRFWHWFSDEDSKMICRLWQQWKSQ